MSNDTTAEKRDPIFHELKSHKFFFKYFLTDIKCYEIRKKDRDYQIGDVLILKEYDPEKNDYTGRMCTREIVYIITGQEHSIGEGLIMMTLIKY